MHQMFFVPYVKIYILMTTMNFPHSLITTMLSIGRIIDKVAFTEIEALQKLNVEFTTTCPSSNAKRRRNNCSRPGWWYNGFLTLPVPIPDEEKKN